MMGSGKTVTGQALARWMRQTFIDLDEYIEKKLGHKIPLIFEQEGEPRFRDYESEALREVAGKEKTIIATGGGIVLRPQNVELMKSRGRVIYLQTSLEWMWKRVQGKTGRPLLNVPDPQAALARIYQEREALYEAASDFQVLTDAKTADEVMKEILAEVN